MNNVRYFLPIVFLSFLSVLTCYKTTYAYQRVRVMLAGHEKFIGVESREGVLLTEGDIIVSVSHTLNKDAVVIPDLDGARWSKGIVPFEIHKDMPDENKHDIYRAIIEIAFHSSLKFIERTPDSSYQDYLFFKPSIKDTCASHVGRKGGKQEVILAPRCKKGSTMHEIFHALGVWHEQSRGDRDSYIQIIWDNIKEDKQYNFSQHLNDGIDLATYDYQSIMHYGAKAFSKNGEKTIIPLEKNAQIGQRDALSKYDIEAISRMYVIDNR